jgi:hypothetical protein
MTDQDVTAKELLDDATPEGKKASDLSELGDEFKGYSPLPSKGQNVKTFEEEELSKKGLTWEKFVGTAYYKDNINAFASLLREESREAEPKEEQAEVKEMVETNTTAKPGVAPVQEKIVVTTENEVIIKTPEAPTRGQGFDIALLAPPKPPVRSAFVSKVVIEASTRKFFHRLKMASDMQFVPSNDIKEAPLRLLKMHQHTLEVYGGIPVGLKNEYIEKDRVVKTEDGVAGFALRDFCENGLHADMQGPILERFRKHQAPINLIKPFLYAREVDFYGLRQEAELMRGLQSIESKNLFDVRDWHDFNRLWDSEELRLAAIDEKVIFSKRRIWMDHKFSNYRLLMDNDPSFAEMVARMVRQHVNLSMRVERQDDRRALSAVFQTIKFNRNTVSFATTIADEIMRANGPATFKEISVLMQLARWVSADIDISLPNQSVPHIVGILMIKLLTPRYIWSERAVLMMHNYLALWLLRSLPGFKLDKSGISMIDFEFEVDQLDRMLSRADWWDNTVDLPTLRDFLLQWSDRGTPAAFGLTSVNGESVATSTKNDHRSVHFWHTDHVALSSTEKAYMTRSNSVLSFAQLVAFERFVSQVEKQAQAPKKWRLLKNELIEPLTRTLSEIVARSEMLRDLAYAFNLTHRFISLHTLTGTNREGQIKRRQNIANFDPAAFANIIFTVEPESMMNLRFDNVFYHKSLSVHDLLSDVGDGIAIVKRYLKDPIFKASERITQAMTFVKAHPLKSWVQEELIERKKVVPFLDFVPRRYLSEKLTLAENFMKSLPSSVLGYARSFIYTNGAEADVISMEPTERFRILLRAKPMKIDTVLTIKDLEKLMLRGELAAFLKNHQGPIRFDIPVGLTSGPPSLSPIFPFSLSGNARVEVSTIPVGFRDGDDEIRHFTDEFAMLMPRAYVSEVQPWEDIPADFPVSKMIHTMTVWSELEFGIELERRHVRP